MVSTFQSRKWRHRDTRPKAQHSLGVEWGPAHRAGTITAMPRRLPPGPAARRREVEFLPEMGYEGEGARPRRRVGGGGKISVWGRGRTGDQSCQREPSGGAIRFGVWGLGEEGKEEEKVESELQVVFGTQEVPTMNPSFVGPEKQKPSREGG